MASWIDEAQFWIKMDPRVLFSAIGAQQIGYSCKHLMVKDFFCLQDDQAVRKSTNFKFLQITYHYQPQFKSIDAQNKCEIILRRRGTFEH